jgi:hypothetical protein
MGLTIHYTLGLDTNSARRVRHVLEQLRRRALELPFEEVGPLVDVSFDAKGRSQGEDARALQEAGLELSLPLEDAGVPPERLIGFSTMPGPGSEPADFTLYHYPAFVVRGRKKVPTGLEGWIGEHGCKTQYASNPAYGGIHNFLKCHLSVIRMLEFADALGILSDVYDEGGYWEHRDLRQLMDTVHEWNVRVATWAGRLKEQCRDGEFYAPIFEFPNFEHLEAEGRLRGFTFHCEEDPEESED